MDYSMHTGKCNSFFSCKCFNNLSSADGRRSAIQETISEFPRTDENAVARSQLSAGTCTDENANTRFNYPAGRNDIERFNFLTSTIAPLYYTYKMLKYLMIAPTCFGPSGPSSGSLC
jgi:hypothetical protein